MNITALADELQEEILAQAHADLQVLDDMEAALRATCDCVLEEDEIQRLTKELREQKLHYETQNMLYDRIRQKLKGRLAEMEELLRESPSDPASYDALLTRLAVYGVFIKRISNWMLLNKMQHQTGTGELYLSIREALDVYQLTGAFGEVRGEEEIEADTRHLMLAFEIFELALRAVYDAGASIMVYIGTKRGFSMRVSVEGASLPSPECLCPPGRSLRGGVLTSSKEDDVTFLRLSYEKEEGT